MAGKIITDYFTWLDGGNIDGIATLLAADVTVKAAFSPIPFDQNAWKGVGEGFKMGFPDTQHQVISWFAKGNQVAVKGLFTGTNTGPMMGNPPTGNKVSVGFNTLFTLDGQGKIKSLDSQFDNKSSESQLMAGINPHAQMETNIRKAYAALNNEQ